MPNQIFQWLWILILLTAFTSCVQAPSTPTPSPEPLVEYPSEFLREGKWELIAYTKDGRPVDVAPVMPVYLEFGYVSEPVNSLSASFQARCGKREDEYYIDGNYLVHFLSSHQIELIPQASPDVGCGTEQQPYIDEINGIGYFLNSYSINDDTLFMRGVDQNSGAEIVTSWRQSIRDE